MENEATRPALDWAVLYVAQGWLVLPLWAAREGRP